jgi:S-adenosylmethionine hydrolase
MTPIITLLTDFGQRDAYAGIMRGVLLGICPTAPLVDLTHAVPPQAVRLGALVLRSAVPYFPDGTIHLAVVDPGVGSARAPVAVRLENRTLFREPVSDTFHGRDLFAPVAAHLAAGVPFETVGTELAALQPLDLPTASEQDGTVDGEIVHVDHFGNLITNVPRSALSAFRPSALSVRIGAMTIAPLVRTYAAVSPGEPAALIGSWGTLEIAVRDGSAAARFGVGVGTPVCVFGE